MNRTFTNTVHEQTAAEVNDRTVASIEYHYPYPSLGPVTHCSKNRYSPDPVVICMALWSLADYEIAPEICARMGFCVSNREYNLEQNLGGAHLDRQSPKRVGRER